MREATINLANLFTVHGRPFGEIMTEGQIVIFAAIVFKINWLVEIICTTQYGKSFVVALATIIGSCIDGRFFTILAPNDEKGKIIMRYYIEHLGDNQLFYSQLEKNTRLERLRQEESKQRVKLRNGGGVAVISLQSRNAKGSIEAAMGFGSPNVILDEANLITDDTESTVYRMGAGQTIEGKSEFNYVKIGNPFYVDPPYTHFKKDWENSDFFRIYIDYKLALKEGRYTQDFINRAMEKPLFDVLYGCEFPPEGLVDDDGYRKLVPSDKVRVVNDPLEFRKAQGKIKVGLDVSGGGDKSSCWARRGKIAMLLFRNQSKDTMVNVRGLENAQKEYGFQWEDVSIDDTGIGHGVSDRCLELGYAINKVNFGESPVDDEAFANAKAEIYWAAGLWITKRGGQFVADSEIVKQAQWIRYKNQTGTEKIIFEPKEILRKRVKQSPDDWDAFALTFYERQFVGFG